MNRSDQTITARQPSQPNSASAAGCAITLKARAIGSLEFPAGKRLPLNVDGTIAALLCDMGIDPALGKTIFIIGRTPGYVAHAHEQMTREKPMKLAAYEDITYTGPARRNVPRKKT